MIENLVFDFIFEEKVVFISGVDFWIMKVIDCVGIFLVMMIDGLYGFCKQFGVIDYFGFVFSVLVICFLFVVGIGLLWDLEIIECVGVVIGVEVVIEDVVVVFGFGINIKCLLLCGCNFEYFFEDLIVLGVFGVVFVCGIQLQGVGILFKYFVVNNQEFDCMCVSFDVDLCLLWEIYLCGFECVVKDVLLWMVMCLYNKFNGVWIFEDFWLFISVLWDDWGFDGFVVFDWGVVNDCVVGVVVGFDLEMFFFGGWMDVQFVVVVCVGEFVESVFDIVVGCVIDFVCKVGWCFVVVGFFDVDVYYVFVREVVGWFIVLLKNDGVLLLFVGDQKVVVIGVFVIELWFQGVGFLLINLMCVDMVFEEMWVVGGENVSYVFGFVVEGGVIVVFGCFVDDLWVEVVEVVMVVDVVVLFFGFFVVEELEGFDCDYIDLFVEQFVVLDVVFEVNFCVVVVFFNGGVVVLFFVEWVFVIVEGWLFGQVGGGVVVDVFYGVVNLFGKFIEMVLVCLEDNFLFGNFLGEFGYVCYGEGLLVGYCWYDVKGFEVIFLFGYGLLYMIFDYGVVIVEVCSDGDVFVCVDVMNLGDCDGREVVQVYVVLIMLIVQCVFCEFKVFVLVLFVVGEICMVELVVWCEDFVYWDICVDCWVVEGGVYMVDVVVLSCDICVIVIVDVFGDEVCQEFIMNLFVGDFFVYLVVGLIVQQVMGGMLGGVGGDVVGVFMMFNDEVMQKMMVLFLIGCFVGFLGLLVLFEQIEQLIFVVNVEVFIVG